ncbi:hypothetical protein CerSpe_070040 [Prunus speciosa]
MVSSFPFSLDLNLAPPTQIWGQGVAPVWMPYFASSRGPVTVNDSLLLDNEVAIGVGKSLVTPKDVRVLGTRDDNQLVRDVMALSVQSTASVTGVGHLLDVDPCKQNSWIRHYTDVVSKGLYFPDVEHVISYDMPEHVEDYVQRIGRTGR